MGGGSFGHGLAVAAHRNGHRVTLWSRRTTVVNADVRTTQSEADLADSDVVFLAIPSEHVRAIAERVGTFLDGRHYLVHVSRGLVGDDLETLTRVLRDATPCRRVGALAGPL
ncbi:MAG: NAD(P)-binding domain-containing protein, partial [Myxococcales bacterium]|nr:NAD(P)-binding domain-containing protein [Myxococcales bacterium]